MYGLFQKSLVLLALSSLAGGCVVGEAPEQEELEDEFIDDADESDHLRHSDYLGTTNLQYEGSCEFLRQCSAYSTDTVNFGCGYQGCSMSDYWVAVPDWRTNLCGEQVKLCRGDNCLYARVKDVSCCSRWEASHAVLRDLGVPHASDPQSCSGYGEAPVAIYGP